MPRTTLTRRTGSALLLDAPPRWCWRGRDVKIVDGENAFGQALTRFAIGTGVGRADSQSLSAALRQKASDRLPQGRIVILHLRQEHAQGHGRGKETIPKDDVVLIQHLINELGGQNSGEGQPGSLGELAKQTVVLANERKAAKLRHSGLHA